MLIDLSLIPLTKCNMNCPFCYLGDMRRDKFITPIETIKNAIKPYNIRLLDIYGGEISLLDENYVDDLISLFPEMEINIVTNGVGFTNSPWMKYLDRLHISISYDLLRPQLDKVKQTIEYFETHNIGYNIISVDCGELDYDYLNQLDGLNSLSIKPFSKSIYQSNNYKTPYMLEIYRKIYSEYPKLKRKLEQVTEYRDKIPHWFLIKGELYDIRYDDNGCEYFCPKNIIDDESPHRVYNKCLSCKYLHKCFNEHTDYYRPVKNQECLGRIRTLEYLDALSDLY